MARLFLHASCPTRREALAHLLSFWPDVVLCDSAREADAAVWDDPAPPTPDVFPPELPRLVLGAGDSAGDSAGHSAPDILATPVRWSQMVRVLSGLLREARHADFMAGERLCVPLERCLYDRSGNEVARLTEKEVRLLEVLAAAGEEGKTRSALLHDVWGYSDSLDTHTLETHIYRLRQKIEDNPDQPRWLVTRDGGYALSGAEEIPED